MLNFERIKELRKNLGITQGEAAKKSGLGSKSRWAHIENGTSINITIEVLFAIAFVLEVEVMDLLSNNPRPKRRRKRLKD